MPLRRRPQWSQSKGAPRALAGGGSKVQKRRRPPHPCRGRLGGPKEKEALASWRRGLRWSHNEGGPHAQVQGALVVPK